jgi:hypothetical protein
MTRNRPYLPAVLAIAISLILLGAVGISAARAAKTPDVKLDAPAPVAKVLRVAVLPLTNATGEVDADKIMGDVLQERFAETDHDKFMFLLPSDVERVLSDANALDRVSRVTDRWSKNGSLDTTALGGLDSLLVADAVLCIKITEWETKRAHSVGEGQSSTTIGLHFALFGIRDHKKMWTKEVREQRLAREIDVTNSSVGYDETGRIQTPGANEPPRVDAVASDLVREALKKFPNK